MYKQERRVRSADMRREEKRKFIPRLYALRRIAPQYRYTLPLHIMKHYRCLVVGGKRGVLTVAITNTSNERVVTYLREQTGCAIFPVLIGPERMRLLLQRVEWSKCHEESVKKRNIPLLHPLLLRSLLPLLPNMS